MSSLALVHPEPEIPAGALLAVTAKSERTTEAYRAGVRRFLAWAGEEAPTVQLFAAFIADSKQNGGSAATVNRDLYAGKAALLQAAEHQGIPARDLAILKTALDAIPALKPGRPEPRTMSAEERGKIEAALGPRLALLARFLYASACRVSEALAVRGADINLELCIARIRILGKGGKERHVRILRSLLEEINSAFDRPGRSLLFETAKGGPLSRTYVTHEIQAAARKVIGRTISAHDYRHSRLTDLYHKTGRAKAVSAYAGHANVSTTLTYYVSDRLSDQELEEE